MGGIAESLAAYANAMGIQTMTPDKRATLWKVLLLTVATSLLVLGFIPATDWLAALLGAK